MSVIVDSLEIAATCPGVIARKINADGTWTLYMQGDDYPRPASDPRSAATLLQQLANDRLANSDVVTLNSGIYSLDAPIVLDLRVSGAPTGRKYASIVGKGSGSTILEFDGDIATAISVIGAALNGQNNGEHRVKLSGITLRRKNTDYQGVGLSVSSMTGLEVDDVAVSGFSGAVLLTDVLSSKIDRLKVAYCSNGLLATLGVYSSANLIKIENSSFAACDNYGVNITGCNVEIDSCAFQGIGSRNVGYTAATIIYANSPDGWAGLLLNNNYFERNKGVADVVIDCSSYLTSVEVGSNSFNRIDSVLYTVNNILLKSSSSNQTTPYASVKLSANGFAVGGNYARSDARPAIGFNCPNGYKGWRITDSGGNHTLYGNSDSFYPDYTKISEYAVVAVSESKVWTPTLTFSVPGDVSVAYSTRVGTCCRVGNICTVNFSITATVSFSTASGALILNGLPYATKPTAGAYTTGAVSYKGIATSALVAFLQPSSNRVDFRASSSDGVWTALTSADVVSGTAITLIGTVVYELVPGA